MESVLRYLDWTSAGLVLLGGLLSLLLLEIFRLNSCRSRSPPGPKPLPFLGNVLQFMKNPLVFVKSLPEHGKVTTVYLGTMPVTVLNNMQVVREAFVQKGAVFADKPMLPIVNWMNKGTGIMMAPFGHSWRQQRRFALHTLRDFGLGKKSVEERVAEEAGYLIKELLKQEGRAFPPVHALMNAASNIICSIVFGDRFDYDNKRFTKLLELQNENNRLAGSLSLLILNVFPIIIHLPGPQKKFMQNFESLRAFILEIVENHRKTLDPTNLRDFIDAYLLEMTKKQEQNEDSTFNEDNMVSSTTDLFFAGTDTTATTLRWAILYMMNHPHVQERCHEEIVQVLGFDRAPCMEDRVRLPYTHATVHEIQRCGLLVPLGVLHQTTEPTKLRGNDLPKGTAVMPNLMAIMTDREHWKHPDTFNPENFLDEKGQFCKNDYFLPFSLGPRVCLGETLARTELFIFFASLLQRLHFSWPPGAPPPNMDGVVAALRSPPPFQTVCRSRETPL